MADSIKVAQLRIFSECTVIIALDMVVSLVLLVFIIVVFGIADCLNARNITPHGTTAAEAII